MVGCCIHVMIGVKKVIEVYCDESRPETIFGRKSDDRFMVIGGIWFPSDERKKIKNKIQYLKKIHNVHGEFKWNKVSPSKIDFYKDLIDYFFQNKHLRFRCIVVDSKVVDLDMYHQSDGELGFYKFYYFMLNKWCAWDDTYRIYLDNKENKMGSRLPDLKRILNSSSFAKIESVLSLDSSESIFVQYADFLIGIVGYVFNEYYSIEDSSVAKNELIELVEEYLGHTIQPTYGSERKFNVFKIALR